MSYQVLARKWRPKNFTDMVGQEHVLQALINAMQQQRLHHAYLFTGTRGVGKTTIARIISKCLNCEKGITSEPCGTCSACQAINQGRFIDLIEIDAASRTKVEDTREILDNVQYAPTQGRYKVYLIDEVHMLSNHSFNALLKTLEEPPPHVIFLLATTDPEKLPITILSRCLQFNLKALFPEQIANRLAYILKEEKISFEEHALNLLSHAAQGSLRDALSLLDQALIYSGGKVIESDVRKMLGTIERKYIDNILHALSQNNAEKLLEQSHAITEQALDYANVLEELLSALHQIALTQITNIKSIDNNIVEFSKTFSKEDIQLYYQICLIGRRDLPLAPNAKIGFEMLLLRLLTFTPKQENKITSSKNESKPLPITKQNISDAKPNVNNHVSESNNQWEEILTKLSLSGLALSIAQNCILKNQTENTFELELDGNHSALLTNKLQERIEEALQNYFNKPLKLLITVSENKIATPAAKQKEIQEKELSKAKTALEKDENVQILLQTFNANIQSNSIKPNNSLTKEEEPS